MMSATDHDDTTDDQLDGTEVYCPACAGTFPPHLEYCPDDGTRLIWWRARVDPLLGTILDGRYEIVRRLGEGGMGLVYEAIQLSVDRRVAIKVIRDELSEDRATAKRFVREARLLTSLGHPNIVDVFDVGQTPDGALYLVMELLRGPTLASLLLAGPMSPRRACELAVQLCDALVLAHGRGVIHRDLKPGNIVIVDAPAIRDLVKVLDFGLAKSVVADRVTTSNLTAAGVVLGTPLYMAPEAAAGAAADPRTDLYALGCILYELLAGVAPFADPAIHVVLARHLSEAPPPLPDHVPRPLRALVDALLAKAPEHRPASAAEVRARLDALLADFELDDAETHVLAPHERPTIAELRPPPVSPSRAPEHTAIVFPRRRPRSFVAVAVVAVVVIVVGIAWWLAIRHRHAIRASAAAFETMPRTGHGHRLDVALPVPLLASRGNPTPLENSSRFRPAPAYHRRTERNPWPLLPS